jgi:hypothetical protein
LAIINCFVEFQTPDRLEYNTYKKFMCVTLTLIVSHSTIYFQLPNSAKLVDEDPIVDEEEIDTNMNNVDDNSQNNKKNSNGHAGAGGSHLGNHDDDDFGVTLSRTYPSSELKKWRKAATVLENRGKPGEMGEFGFCLVLRRVNGEISDATT